MSYDVLVIGGGPAGLSAAVNARARGRSVLVVSNPLEENPLWKAEKVDNHLGMPNMTGAEMLRAFHRHAVDAGVEFRSGKVLNAMRMEDTWYVSIESDMENAKALVLAAGVAAERNFRARRPFWAAVSATAPPATVCCTGAKAWPFWDTVKRPDGRRSSSPELAAP